MKFKTLPFRIRTLVACFSSVCLLHAQNPGNDAKVSMHIDFVSWGEDLSGLEVRDGEKLVPVSALAFRYSKPLKYTGPRTLALVLGELSGEAARQEAEDLEAWRSRLEKDGIELPDAVFEPKEGPQEIAGEIPESLAKARENTPDLAALVKLPASSRRVTVLLAPGPDRSLVPHVFDDDPSRQPLGMVRVHNFSPHPISLRIADGKIKELAPGKNFLAPAPKGVFFYELAYKIEGDWKVQENNLVNVRANQQMHMVVLRSGSSFFSSSDGSRGGFMQTALLRRTTQ